MGQHRVTHTRDFGTHVTCREHAPWTPLRLLLGALRPPRTLFLQLIKPVTMVCGLMVWDYIQGARDRPPGSSRSRLNARVCVRGAEAIIVVYLEVEQWALA